MPEIKVKFESTGPKFLLHKGQSVTLNAAGNGSFNVNANEFDLILFGIEGAPGTAAKITLSVTAPAVLEIEGHPIEGKVAQARTVWGGSRFFRVKGGA
jgi:hypothetical protein